MFKKLSMLIAFVCIAVILKADDGQKIASKVQKVTVFLSGAQIARTATVNIPVGTSTLTFDGLSQELDPASMQVHAEGQFTILSVQHELSNANDPAKAKQLELLEASKKDIKEKITFQNELASIYQSEETTLMKNQLVKAENAALDVLVLKQALDFQTQRLTLIKEKEFSIANQTVALTAELQKINQQINIINTGNSLRTSNIIVTVYSKAALQATFFLSYVINGAMWYPSYDIKAKNVTSPITIVYNANVSQTSGEEWKDVKIALSTGNPSVSGIKPDLNPDYLNFLVNTGMTRKLQGAAAGMAMEKVSHDEALSETAPVAVTTVENQTNFEFNIDNAYTIASNGKVCTVEINQVEVKASYQYYVAPKLNTDVFLTAQLTDWNKYNFLSGEANLFFEGTYIGKSNIDINSTQDTLSLSLGVDKNIVVTRNLQKELSVRQSLGSNKKETKDWRIEVKNRKNQAINLLVEDQVPVSQISSIEVEVQETSGVKPDPLTGKVSWNFALKPQEDKKVELKYLVKYPKNETVVVQ